MSRPDEKSGINEVWPYLHDSMHSNQCYRHQCHITAATHDGICGSGRGCDHITQRDSNGRRKKRQATMYESMRQLHAHRLSLIIKGCRS